MANETLKQLLIPDELLARLEAFDQGIHDIKKDPDGFSYVVCHFIEIGLKVEEERVVAAGGELF